MTRRELATRFRNAWGALTLKTAIGPLPSTVPGYPAPWPSIIPQASPTLALQSAAVWSCVNIISKAVASLPAQLLERSDVGSSLATKHPMFALLTRTPNPMMTLQQWLQPTMLHLLLYGNAFTFIDRQDGEIVGLWPLPVTRVRLFFRGAQAIEYTYYDNRGQSHVYEPGVDLIHFRLFSLDGFIGLSVLQYQQIALQFQDSASQYALNLYQNGGRPGGVIEYPNTLVEQINKIRASWSQIHGGAENAGKVAILDNGAKYTPINMPPDALQYIDTQQYSVEQIARIFGVAPHLIGASKQPTYASVEQQSIEFVRYTIAPYVHALETSIDSALLDEPFFYRLNMNAFERSDLRSRYGAYATGRQWGWLSVNDIRALEDLNTIGESGDIYLQPSNMAPAGSNPLEPAPTGAP